MKTLTATLLLSLLATPALAAADDAGIKAALTSFAEAWNHHDAKAMAATYTTDAALIDPFATGRGRAGIEKQFAALLAGPGKASSTTLELVHSEPLDKNLTLIDVMQTVTGLSTPDGKPLPPTKFSVGCVAKKTGGSWSFLYCHVGMLPPPPPAAPTAAK